MAISDLINEIQKDNFKIDQESERKIITKLLEMVAKDGSGDVKALAVKALGPLATHAQETQVQNMIEKLGNYLLDDGMQDEIRDISSIGLKTVIAEIPDTQLDTVKLVIKILCTRVVDAIAKAPKPEIVMLCLDILNDLLSRWGKEIGKQKALYEKIQKSVLPQLTSPQSAGRKKAVGCLSYLSLSTPDDIFSELVTHLANNIGSAKKVDQLRTFVSAIGSISRSVGYRLGKHLPAILPLLFQHFEKATGEDDEVRENCLQVFESVLLRCPKESDAYLEKIEALCLKYISYDPNFDSDNEAHDEEMELSGEEDYDDGDYDFSDDDDVSWKVRKGTVRCLIASIKTRPERLNIVIDNIVPTLVKRFKEREETVKLDIFSAFGEILKQLNIVHAGKDSRLTQQIQDQVPSIVTVLTKELKGKSLKTRPGVFQLLVELVTVIPGCLEKHVSAFIPGISVALGDKNTTSSLKIDALVFLRCLLQHHSPQVFHPQLNSLLPPIYKAAEDRYYKIVAEALRVCSQVARVLNVEGFNSAPYVDELYKVSVARLKLLDVDQEVKEASIECAGNILTLLGDGVSAEVALKIFVDRLNNEVTRLVTIKVFEQISVVVPKPKVDLTAILPDVIKILTTFLKKQNRQLKQATLSCLSALIKAFGKNNKPATSQFESVIKELSSIINEQDLHLSHLALRVAGSMVRVHSRSAEKVKNIILPPVYELLKSSLFQGLALESLLALYKDLIVSKAKIPADSLISGLVGITNQEGLSKQSYHSIAQCVSVLVAKMDEEVRVTMVDKFVNDIANTKKESEKLLALYCIGEIGRRVDLSANKDLKKNIFKSFDSQSEEIKTAASVALGCIAVGNMVKFFPDILDEIDSNPKRQYLLLGSLREVIVRLSSSSKGKTKLSRFIDKLLSLLFGHTGTEEEGTRNVVSECLGKLALIEPSKVIPELAVRTAQTNTPVTKACVTTALKSALSDKNPAVDSLLSKHIASFLSLLSDSSILVRKSVLLSLNYCAHHKPDIVSEFLGKYLELLYGETKVKKELIREVDLGPFKHKVDDGIELRLASFEVMYTLLDTCLSKLVLPEFIEHLTSGLGDVYDIQMLNHLILARLSKKAPAALLAGLDGLVEPLRAAVTSKPKEAAVKQQVERNDELIRSALRAVVFISKIEGIENSFKFQEFLRTTILQGALSEKYEAIVKEQLDK